VVPFVHFRLVIVNNTHCAKSTQTVMLQVVGYKDMNWMELISGVVEWWASMSALLKLRFP
jgi:hypothetical protein